MTDSADQISPTVGSSSEPERPAPRAGLEYDEAGRLDIAARGGPLRIAILGSRGFPSTYGGYETLVRHLARTWAADGHSVAVYCRTREAGTPTRIWEIEGVRCIWTPGRDSKSASTLTYGLTSHVDVAFRHHDAALVLNVANGFFLPLLRAANIASVVNTDGLEWQRGKWGTFARRAFYAGAQFTARHADLLVSDSLAIADIWQHEFGVRPTYIPYGADALTDPSRDRLAELSLEPRQYVLVVARLIPENNVDLTLDALERTASAHPVVVVGSANYDSLTADRLGALAETGAIRWLGHVADQELLTQLWAHAGVYIHGHSVGGTNPALLQALGAGAPTLALDTAFNREVIGASEQLYPADATALARQIDGVLGDGSLQARWTVRGRTLVRERFRWQAVCDSYESMLRQAISARHA